MQSNWPEEESQSAKEMEPKRRPWWFWAIILGGGLFVVLLLMTIGNLARAPGGFAGEKMLSDTMMERAKSEGYAGPAEMQLHTFSEAGSGARVANRAPAAAEADREMMPREQVAAAQNVAYSLETWGRQLILRAEMGFEVEDVRAAFNRVQAVAAAQGALVTSANLEAGPEPADDEEDGGGYGHATIVLRMPQSQFREIRASLLNAAGQMEARIVKDVVATNDVTEEYIDLQARLKHWRAQEVQYLELMRQARKVADIIAVSDKVSNVQREIERLEGRLRFLENRVDLSTISVEIYGKGKAPVEPTLGATFQQAGKDIKAAWKKSIMDMAKIVIWISFVIAYLLPFAIVAGIVWMIVKTARKKAAAKPEG